MKITTKRFGLLSLLEKAAYVVPTKDLMPVLKNFYIEVTDAELRVCATDLDLSVIASTSLVTIDKPGIVVVPAKRLLEIVKEAPEGEIVIESDLKEVNVMTDRCEWTLKLPPDASEYPLMPDSSVERHPTSAKKLSTAIRAVRHSASVDAQRANLMMLDVSGSDKRMRAADGVRFQQVSFEFPIDCQLPLAAIDDLLKILNAFEGDSIEVGQDENAIVFFVGPDVFVVQKLVAEFPDMDAVLLKPAEGNDQEFKVDRVDLISAIRRIRITAPESLAVMLALTEKKVEVSSKDTVYGYSSKETLDCDWSGPDRLVAFNHKHLLDLLQMAQASTCHCFLGPDTKTRPSALLLKDVEAKMVGVLSQLRVDFL